MPKTLSQILLASVLTILAGCYKAPELPLSENPYFQRGFSYAVFSHNVLFSEGSEESLDRMMDTGANWVALVPIWYQDDRYSTSIYPKATETPSDESLRYAINYLQGCGIHIMLKPYVDVEDGTWRAEIEPQDWGDWFDSYREFIWHYAEIAEEMGVELFCVGCEYITSDSTQEEEWCRTIDGIKERYSRELTYSANWSDYQEVCFWEELDYVGIDAYFPLTENEDADVVELVAGWERELDNIDQWRIDYGYADKLVILTEVGYRSTVAPWVSPGFVTDFEVSQHDQELAFLSLFLTAPARPWVQGIFIWWWDNPSTADWKGGRNDNGYTPRGKQAEKLIKYYYSSYPEPEEISG